MVAIDVYQGSLSSDIENVFLQECFLLYISPQQEYKVVVDILKSLLPLSVFSLAANGSCIFSRWRFSFRSFHFEFCSVLFCPSNNIHIKMSDTFILGENYGVAFPGAPVGLCKTLNGQPTCNN